ncbi:MAG TPA: hypothetical protein EYG80_04120 [Flavobacteriaceae bacterium]|nr:hypothetical protein [Flavobacteriaceae bacterium]
MNQIISGVILTAAKADVTICEVFGELPTGLIPVNGKPIIFYILHQFISNGITDVYIGVDYKEEKLKEIVNLYFENKINIIYLYTDKNKGPGNSLLTILKNIKSTGAIVNLGDTYIKDLEFNNLSNQVVISNDFINEERWAVVETNTKGQIEAFSEKKKGSHKNLHALTGVYRFNNISAFNDYVEDNEKLQISDLLQYYHQSVATISTCITKGWLDFGHIDKYYISKKRLIQSRGFNSLEYNDLLGTITKKSKNVEKFRAEIRWQLDLPKNIKVLAPRVLDYSIGDNPFIKMEFYSYPTLAEIWLFSELNENIYFSIIDKLFKVMELFRQNKQNVSLLDYQNMYIDKTKQRLSSITNNTILELLTLDKIIINGKQYDNWNILEEQAFDKITNLFIENDNCFIHGDFCLSNILYDLRSGITRLIDPRGIWGSNENGDIKYDVAKLRHSVCGDYDYIVNDLFQINVMDNEVKYSIYNSNKYSVKEYFDNQVSKYYDLNHIKLIEGLLFLSMISLHDDNPKRQLVMYAKSIKLLNEVHENI